MKTEKLDTEEAANYDLDTSGNSSAQNGWLDFNTLSLEQMVERLRKKYMLRSSGDAKCIYHLIEFYDKHK